MKTFAIAAMAILLTTSFAAAGILDGAPADAEKRARPGGYDEQVANRKSMASGQGSCPPGYEYHAGCIPAP